MQKFTRLSAEMISENLLMFSAFIGEALENQKAHFSCSHIEFLCIRSAYYIHYTYTLCQAK